MDNEDRSENWLPSPGQYERYVRALREDPKNVQIRYDYAQELLNEGHTDFAVVQLVETNSIDADLPGVHSILGGIYAERGDTEGAIHEYRELLRCYSAIHSPRMTLLARCILGKAYAAANRWDEAQEQLDAAMGELREDTDPMVILRINSLSETLRINLEP
jgi:tetratricopeptide (TPR) repeat protein